MTSIDDITRQWDEFLTGFGEQDVELLLTAQRERGLLMHDRPVCLVARPHFVEADEYARHKQVVMVLSDAIRKARDYLVADREREAEHLGQYYDWIGELVSLEPAEIDHGAIARLDAFRTGEGLRFIEFNGDCPGGTDHNDGLARLFQETETFRAMAKKFSFEPLMLQPATSKALLDAWKEWGGTHAPTMAVVGWFEREGITPDSVLQGTKPLLNSGVGSIIAVEPSDLEFDGNHLSANGTKIDLVYRVMLTRDVLASRDDVRPLLDALAKQAVCMVNPFRSELMGHKALFALLTDPDAELGLDSTEQDVIRQHVPWGRLFREGMTTDAAGNRIDLVDYVVTNREDTVLKPTHEAKGDGVELGWQHDTESWGKVVKAGLESDFIVQKRIPTHQAQYPAAEPGTPLTAVYEDTDPFVARGELAGFLTRLSRSEIVNVSKSGSVVPTYVVRS